MDKAAQEIFNKLHKSVVSVICRTSDNPRVSVGSGFIIGKTTKGYLVMTYLHIIKELKNPVVTVRVPSDDKDTKEYEAEVVKVTSEDGDVVAISEDEIDLALIQVYGLNRECQALEFCDAGDIEKVLPRTVLFVLGYINQPTRKGVPSTLNLVPAVSPAVVSTPLQKHGPGGLQDVVYTAASKHGASGGAVIFGTKVLGVHCDLEFGSHTCYARSANTVNMKLKDWLRIGRHETRTTKELIEVLQSRTT